MTNKIQIALGALKKLHSLLLHLEEKEVLHYFDSDAYFETVAAIQALEAMQASEPVAREFGGTFDCPICGSPDPHKHPVHSRKWARDYLPAFKELHLSPATYLRFATLCWKPAPEEHTLIFFNEEFQTLWATFCAGVERGYSDSQTARIASPIPAPASEPLITVEASLRFQLDCIKEKLEQAEYENRELRGRLSKPGPAKPELTFAITNCHSITFNGDGSIYYHIEGGGGNLCVNFSVDRIASIRRVSNNTLNISLSRCDTPAVAVAQEQAGQAVLSSMQKLTDTQRLEIMSNFCKSCGSTDNRCQCWNDE